MRAKKQMNKTILLWSVIAGAVAICILVALLPFRAVYHSVSGSNVGQLSDLSKQYLQGIDEDVEIIYYSEGGKLRADKELYGLVLRIASENARIRVRLESPRYGSDMDQCIEIRSEKRSKLLKGSELFYFYDTIQQATMSQQERSRYLLYLSQSVDETTYQQYLTEYLPVQFVAFSCYERSVISAVRYVLAEEAPSLYVYDNGYGISDILAMELADVGYSLTKLNALTELPQDCEGLYLSTVTDLTGAEASALSAYLARGGRVFLTTYAQAAEMPYLSDVLKEYGLSAPDVVNMLYSVEQTQQIQAISGDHYITDRFGNSFVAYGAHRIDHAEVEGVTHRVLLYTPSDSYHVRVDLAEGEMPDQGSFSLCTLAEKEDSAILWLAMPLDYQSNALSGNADFEFAVRCFNYLTDHEGQALNIQDTQVPSSYMSVPSGAAVVWMVVFVIAVPMGVVIAGSVRYYYRKKRVS